MNITNLAKRCGRSRRTVALASVAKQSKIRTEKAQEEHDEYFSAMTREIIM
jgi:hypothetical protein